VGSLVLPDKRSIPVASRTLPYNAGDAEAGVIATV
jgi:hypothetical protein